jgi:hypothetical protein
VTAVGYDADPAVFKPVRGLGKAASVLSALAALVFLFWLWRVRDNSEILHGPEAHRRSAGWTLWGWVVSVVDFWFPYQVVRDLDRAATGRESAAVPVWWRRSCSVSWPPS